MRSIYPACPGPRALLVLPPSPSPSAYVVLRVRKCIWSTVRTRRRSCRRERIILGLCTWSVIRLGGTNDVRLGSAAHQLRPSGGAALPVVPVRHTEWTTVCRSSHRSCMLSIALRVWCSWCSWHRTRRERRS
jgi:hypothetical protein